MRTCSQEYELYYIDHFASEVHTSPDNFKHKKSNRVMLVNYIIVLFPFNLFLCSKLCDSHACMISLCTHALKI